MLDQGMQISLSLQRELESKERYPHDCLFGVFSNVAVGRILVC